MAIDPNDCKVLLLCVICTFDTAVGRGPRDGQIKGEDGTCGKNEVNV